MTTGLVLLVLGTEALFYGGFSYIVDNRNDAEAGVAMSSKQLHSVEFPLYGGTLGVALGGLMLLQGNKRRRSKR